MQHVLGTGKSRRGRPRGADILPMAAEIGIGAVMREVAAVAAGQIVNDVHPVPAFEAQVDQMAADEASSTGDNDEAPLAHAACSLFSRRTLKYWSSCMLFGRRPSRNAVHRSSTASSIVYFGVYTSMRLILL